MFINIYKQVIKRSQNGRPFNVCISAIFERDYQKYDAISSTIDKDNPK